MRIQCRESYPPPSRLPARSVRGRAPPALAHPPPVRGMSGRGWLVGTGGGFYFSYIKFFKGAGLGCRLGRSWTVPTGHQDPPCTPKGILSPDSLFYFVLVESGTCLPLWGGRRSRVGRRFLPGDSHPLPPPVVTVCAGSRLATTGGRDYSLHLISKGGDGRQWRPSIADRGGSRDQAPPLKPPVGRGSGGK